MILVRMMLSIFLVTEEKNFTDETLRLDVKNIVPCLTQGTDDRNGNVLIGQQAHTDLRRVGGKFKRYDLFPRYGVFGKRHRRFQVGPRQIRILLQDIGKRHSRTYQL